MDLGMIAAQLLPRREAPMGMVYAAIDIHKQTLHAAVLDPRRARAASAVSLPPARKSSTGRCPCAASWRRSRSRRRPGGGGIWRELDRARP